MHSWNPWIHSWNLGIESLESWQESEVPNPRNPQIHPQIRSPRWSHCIPGWMHYLSTTISYYPSYSIHSMHTPNTILHPTYQEQVPLRPSIHRIGTMSRVITRGIILKQSIPPLESTWNPCLESTNNQYISPCILYKCIVSYQHTSTTGSLPEWSQIPRIPGIPKIQEKSFLIAQIMSLIPFCGVKYRDSNTPPPDQTPRWSPVGPPTNYYVYPITHHTVYIPCKYLVGYYYHPTQNGTSQTLYPQDWHHVQSDYSWNHPKIEHSIPRIYMESMPRIYQ